jgi:hypothetical protein
MKAALWKCQAMDAKENQSQVSLSAHSPWKSLLRFPHSHSAGEGDGKVESQNQASHFPTARLCPSQIQTQKGGLKASRFAPAFRLILRLENAARSTIRVRDAEVMNRGFSFFVALFLKYIIL